MRAAPGPCHPARHHDRVGAPFDRRPLDDPAGSAAPQREDRGVSRTPRAPAPTSATARRPRSDSGRTRRSRAPIKPPIDGFAERRLEPAQLPGRQPVEWSQRRPEPPATRRRPAQLLELGCSRMPDTGAVLSCSSNSAPRSARRSNAGPRAPTLAAARRAPVGMPGGGQLERIARSRRASPATASAGSTAVPTGSAASAATATITPGPGHRDRQRRA